MVERASGPRSCVIRASSKTRHSFATLDISLDYRPDWRSKYRAYAAASFDLANNLLKSAWFASLALSRTILETNQELLRAGGERPRSKATGRVHYRQNRWVAHCPYRPNPHRCTRFLSKPPGVQAVLDFNVVASILSGSRMPTPRRQRRL
jgi:hypothetical protein